jgi:hypothetical protein
LIKLIELTGPTTPCAADGLNLPQGTQKEKKISNLIDEPAIGFGTPAWFGKNQPFNSINQST